MRQRICYLDEMIFADNLPIKPVIPEIQEVLEKGVSAVLQAPPGAGKTTLVPLSLINEPWMSGKRVIMLEPRRLAARAAAMRMSDLLGEKVGEPVGYRTRLDSRVGPQTRIEVVTEGILTRRLQNDPSLDGVGLLIFDEFHERSLHADLGLALSLESRSLLRPDLRILIMSATLEGKAVARLLGHAPVITSEGRSFPVETRYLPPREQRQAGDVQAALSDAVAAVKRALKEEEGDILLFLPGAGEIRRVEKILRGGSLPPDLTIAPLYGDLPKERQDRAIAPSPEGKRKIVLATAIAETSLTIEGIKVVIDSGLMRIPRFSPGSGMSRLETVRITRASADQRRGRAGRLSAGICYRLWTEGEDKALIEENTPEIREADLSPLALELALWGVRNPDELAWLDAPPRAAMAHANELLTELEAVDSEGKITAMGRKMAGLPLHPRLAHMVIRSEPLGLTSLACRLAALMSERDFITAHPGFYDSDVRLRVELLHEKERHALPPGLRMDDGARRRIGLVAAELQRKRHGREEKEGTDETGLLLAFAYPDRIARKRPGTVGRFLMTNGRGAFFLHPEGLSQEEYIVAASLDGAATESRIFLAAPLSVEEIERNLSSMIIDEASVTWDKTQQAVRARKTRRLMHLILREEPILHPDRESVCAALMEGIRQNGIGCLPWTKEARRFQARAAFLHRQAPGFPDLRDEALMTELDAWLPPWLDGLSRLAHLQRIDLKKALTARLTWHQQQQLERLAPTHLTVPSGSRIPVDYSQPEKPVLAVRLQELFGLDKTPSLADDKVPLTLHLLSPANRPIQVTDDLAGFWEKSYFDVRKDLRGRYPKHDWPDDPLRATATKRAKMRKE